MLQIAPLKPDHLASVPERSRPLVRYRRESFGWLAGFPDGHVALCKPEAGPLLAAGAGYEECLPHLLTDLSVPTEFHFAGPLMVWLELTRDCNLSCSHCFAEGGSARGGELDTPRILTLLEEFAGLGVFCVVITGGEPLLHPDFESIVARAHALGFVLGIATNLALMTDERLARLPRTDLIINVSLDGLHGQGRATGETDFEFVTRRLPEVQAAGFNTSLMTTTTRGNIKDLHRIIDWAVAHDVGLRSVPFVPMGRGGAHLHHCHAVEDAAEVARFWIKEEEWERIHDVQFGLSAGRIFGFLLTMSFAIHRCMSGRGICYITSNGDVFPCTTCAGSKVLVAGNLEFESLERIWNGAWDIRGITWDTFKEACRDCDIASEEYYCTSRCPGSSSVLNRRLDGCGASEFLKLSIIERERLFKERIRARPAVPVRTVPLPAPTARPQL